MADNKLTKTQFISLARVYAYSRRKGSRVPDERPKQFEEYLLKQGNDAERSRMEADLKFSVNNGAIKFWQIIWIRIQENSKTGSPDQLEDREALTIYDEPTAADYPVETPSGRAFYIDTAKRYMLAATTNKGLEDAVGKSINLYLQKAQSSSVFRGQDAKAFLLRSVQNGSAEGWQNIWKAQGSVKALTQDELEKLMPRALRETVKYEDIDEFVEAAVKDMRLLMDAPQPFPERLIDHVGTGLNAGETRRLHARLHDTQTVVKRAQSVEKAQDEVKRAREDIDGIWRSVWRRSGSEPQDPSPGSIAKIREKSIDTVFDKLLADFKPQPTEKDEKKAEKEVKEAEKKAKEDAKKAPFFYVWWLFENKASYDRVANGHQYPRAVAAAQLTHIPNIPPEVDAALQGRKTDSPVEGFFLARGLIKREQNIMERIPLPQIPETFRNGILTKSATEGGPIIALGAARMQLSNLDVNKLEWRWAPWLGKKDMTGVGENVTIKGRVVDNKKVMDALSIDLLELPGNTIPTDILKQLLDMGNDFGLEDAAVSVKMPDGKGEIIVKKTSSKGDFIYEKAPKGINLTLTASRSRYVGYGKVEDAPSTSPWKPGTPVNTTKDYNEVLIPLEKEKTVPKGPLVLVTIAANDSDDHSEPLKKMWGQGDKLTKVGGKNSTMTFTLTKRNFTGGSFALECLITKMDDASGKVIRDDAQLNKVLTIEDQAAWQADWVLKLGGKPKYESPFNRIVNIGSGDVNHHTLSPRFTVPEGAQGKYRIWAFLLKNQTDVAGLNPSQAVEKLCNLSHDFNYYEFIVGKNESRANASKEKPSEKEVKQISEKLDKKQSDMGSKGQVKYADKEFHEATKNLLGTIVANPDAGVAFCNAAPDKQVFLNILKNAIALGLYARIWLGEKEENRGAVAKRPDAIKSLFAKDKDLKTFQDAFKQTKLTLDFGSETLESVGSMDAPAIKNVKDFAAQYVSFASKGKKK